MHKLISVYSSFHLDRCANQGCSITYLISDEPDPSNFERKLRMGQAFIEETENCYAHPPCPFLLSDDWIHCGSWESEDRDLDWWVQYLLSYTNDFLMGNMMDESFRALAQYLDHPAAEGKVSVNGYSQLITWTSWYFEKSIQRFGTNDWEKLKLRNAFSDKVLNSMMERVYSV